MSVCGTALVIPEGQARASEEKLGTDCGGELEVLLGLGYARVVE